MIREGLSHFVQTTQNSTKGNGGIPVIYAKFYHRTIQTGKMASPPHPPPQKKQERVVMKTTEEAALEIPNQDTEF